MKQLSYQVLKPEEFKPDYTSSRRYGPILRRMWRALHSDRHQIIFTDNVQKTGDILTNYALHVDSLKDGRLSKIEKALIAFSLSSDEVALSPQIYVGDTTEDPGENTSEPGTGDAVNQKRFDPRIFTEVIRVDFRSPLYKEWAKDMLAQVGHRYEHMDKDKRDVWLFTEHDIAPILLKYFEADQNKILFINEIPQPTNNEEKQILLRSLQRGLCNEKRYSFDHGDYVQRIPNVIWTVPFDLYGEFEDQYDIKCGITTYEYPDESFLLHKPFNKWLKDLSERFKILDEKRKSKGHSMTMSRYVQERLEDVLESISEGEKRTRKERKLNNEQLLKFLGLTREELVYLENFQRATR